MTVRVTNRPDPEQWPDDLACALATVADPHPEGVGMFLGQTLTDPFTDSCPEYVPGTARDDQWPDGLGNTHVHHWPGERCYLKQNHGGPHISRTDAPFVWVRLPDDTWRAEEWYTPTPRRGPQRKPKPGSVGYLATFANDEAGRAAMQELRLSLAPGLKLRKINGGPQGSNPHARARGACTIAAETEYFKVYIDGQDHLPKWRAQAMQTELANWQRRAGELRQGLIATERRNAELLEELNRAQKRQPKAAPPRPSTNPLAWIPEHLRAKAYAALAKICHPDTGGDNATMQTLNKAYHGRPNR